MLSLRESQISGLAPHQAFFCYASLWTTEKVQHALRLKSVDSILLLVGFSFPHLLVFFYFWWAPRSIQILTHFSRSVCATSLTLRGKSGQRSTCSKWVHLRYSFVSWSKLKPVLALTAVVNLYAVSRLLLKTPNLPTQCHLLWAFQRVYLHCVLS